jgi:hypothetical protein
MAWMQKLYETYEKCVAADLPDAKHLLPIAHTTQQAHIEIVIDGEGQRSLSMKMRQSASEFSVAPAAARA